MTEASKLTDYTNIEDLFGHKRDVWANETYTDLGVCPNNQDNLVLIQNDVQDDYLTINLAIGFGILILLISITGLGYSFLKRRKRNSQVVV